MGSILTQPTGKGGGTFENPIYSVPLNIIKKIVKWVTNIDFDKGSYTNTEVSGTGNSAVLQLEKLDDNSDNVEFTTPTNYTYPAEIEVVDGKAKLKQTVAGDYNWPFSVPENYTYPAEITVADGKAALTGDALAPYAWYHLNESAGTNVPDSSGNGYNGTTVNMEDGDWQAGKLNNCLTFDGVNEYVNCGDIANFERNESFSTECWFKSGSSAAQDLISRLQSASPNQGWGVTMITGQIYVFIVSSLTSSISVHVPTSYADNAWHHLAVTYDGSSLASGVHVYVDNSDKTLTVDTDNLSSSIQYATNCQISGRSGANYTFNGQLDEVVIYDLELTAENVSSRYNEGAGTESMPGAYSIDNPAIYPSIPGYVFATPLSIFIETATKPTGSEIKLHISIDDGVTWLWYGSIVEDLYAHWHLNESTGSVAYDSGPNGYDGELKKMENEDWVSGKLNNCLLFDGNDEHVDCGDIASFERTDIFTIETWFKTNASINQAIIGRMDKDTPYQGWLIRLDNGEVYFELSNSIPVNNFIRVHVAGTDYADNAWHYLAVTYDGSSLASGVHIYVDGFNKTLTVDQDTLTATIQNAKYMDIGAREGGNLYFNGYLDEIVICLKELTLQQVLFRWNGGAGTEELLCSWEETDNTYEEANLASIINTYISYAASTGIFKFRALLHSDTGLVTPELDNVYIAEDVSYPIGDWPIAMNFDIEPSIIYQWLLFIETATKPGNTDIKYQYSVNSGSNYNGTWLTTAEIQTAMQAISSPVKIRFKVQLSTLVGTVTPEIDNINVTSNTGYVLSGEYESNVYNSTYRNLIWGVVEFDVNIPAGTLAIKVRAGDASPLGNYSSALINGESAGVIGQYLQWKAEFTGTGMEGPTINFNGFNFETPKITEVSP